MNAEGSGAAALLLFTHIAVVGYLTYCWWFLGSDRTTWPALALRPATWQFYMVPWYGVLTFLPTDKLTKIVGRIAQAIAGVSLIAFIGFGLIGQAHSGLGGASVWQLAMVVLISSLPAISLKVAFASAMPAYRGKLVLQSKMSWVVVVAAVGGLVCLFVSSKCGILSGFIYGILAIFSAILGILGWRLSKSSVDSDEKASKTGLVASICALALVWHMIADAKGCPSGDGIWAISAAWVLIGMPISRLLRKKMPEKCENLKGLE